MSVEQFTVQQISIILTIIPIALIILGAVLLSAGFSKKLAHFLATYSLKARPTENRYVYLITGAIVISVGAVIFMGNAVPSTITVGDQYISYESSFLGAGSMTIPSDQIANAYVAALGQGELTMSRTFGTASGDVCVGLFTLGNGHTAHVLTNNNTSLIIELTNGEYVILGISDMDALTASFSQNVYSLQQPLD